MAQTLFSQSESALDCSKKRKKKVVGWPPQYARSLSLSLSATGMVVSVEDVLSRL